MEIVKAAGRWHADVIVIGSGQAGPTLTSRLTAKGMTVAFIEREHFGGTCVNVGCVPKKAMWLAADLAHRMGLARALAEGPMHELARDHGIAYECIIDGDVDDLRQPAPSNA